MAERTSAIFALTTVRGTWTRENQPTCISGYKYPVWRTNHIQTRWWSPLCQGSRTRISRQSKDVLSWPCRSVRGVSSQPSPHCPGPPRYHCRQNLNIDIDHWSLINYTSKTSNCPCSPTLCGCQVQLTDLQHTPSRCSSSNSCPTFYLISFTLTLTLTTWEVLMEWTWISVGVNQRTLEDSNQKFLLFWHKNYFGQQ